MAHVLIISNRLPVSVTRVDGKLIFSASIGGLATGLESYVQNKQNKWIGWPGISSDDLSKTEKQLIIKRLAKHNYHPVFLTRQQVDLYYNGYSNALLWPLFHSLPVQDPAKHKQWWQTYREVNKLFADAALGLAKGTSHIWVHDYQLFLVPQLIRIEQPKLHIGFFLHIPFPAAKSFMRFREAKQLLQGILGANLVGFHTENYVVDFIENCRQAKLGVAEENQIILPLRSVQVSSFPMGIDYQKYANASQLPAVRQAVKRLKRQYAGKKIIAAVDRLDISKGFVERLIAYRKFLAQNSQLHGKVVFVLVGAPSRTELARYQKLGAKVAKLVSEINTSYGTKRWQPIDYINHALPFEEVTALFHVADVAFIAPLRDGMNLAAKEFVASSRKHGVLILSETAGAAEELKDALLVNPRDPTSSVAALQQALAMPKHELQKRLKDMQDQLSSNTVQMWASNFMQALQKPIQIPALGTQALTKSREQSLITAYRAAGKRLLLFDYDGTLSPLVAHFKDAVPTPKLLSLLKRLAADPSNEIVIISGRSAKDLGDWFGKLKVTLVAEHGAMTKKATAKSWVGIEASSHSWQEGILPILACYVKLAPYSRIEVKKHALVWHYRETSPYYARKYSVVLKRVLRQKLRGSDVGVFEGKKVIEVKNRYVNKGVSAKALVSRKYDFILCLGDDKTDEDMFAAMPKTAYTIKVGAGRTAAQFRLNSVANVIALLDNLTH